MNDLTYTLISDGSSDSALMPILDWLLRGNGVQCAIQRQWADLRWLRRPPAGLAGRLRAAVDLFPCDLLFVHRDAEAELPATRREEIAGAVIEAFDDLRRPAWVPVIPVRMSEAWLLFNEAAIRKAAGNPSGRSILRLPSLARSENLPDPKNLLWNLLCEASELSPRRRAQLQIGPMRHRITEYTRDFSPLRTLAAFAALEHHLKEVIATNGWDRR